MAVQQPQNSPAAERVLRSLFAVYLRLWHGFEVHYGPSVPHRGPFLALSSHFSLLDPVALIVADPDPPRTTLVVSAHMMQVPLVSQVLKVWGAVPVARDGRDIVALRLIRRVLGAGRGICIAAQGTRSRTGRLGPMHPALMRLAAGVARDGIPVVPIAVVGSYESLPPGAHFPRRHKIQVIADGPVDLVSEESVRRGDGLARVAEIVQDGLSRLLPPERRPAPGTPALASPSPAEAGEDR